MNNYLVDFIDDELKNNNYYEAIQKFAEGKDWNKEILSPVVNEYEDYIDDFGPYRFMDAIEDYLRELIDQDKLSSDIESLDEVIEMAWDDDWFNNY